MLGVASITAPPLAGSVIGDCSSRLLSLRNSPISSAAVRMNSAAKRTNVMKRDLLPRFAGFTAALAVIFAAACLWYGARAARLEAYVGLQNERALSALSAALDGLDVALRKTALLPAGELRSMALAGQLFGQGISHLAPADNHDLHSSHSLTAIYGR